MNQSFSVDQFNIRTGAVWQGDCPEGWIEPNRRIYDYELVFFSRGSCRVITEDQTFFCREGSVMIIPPGHEHCSIADSLCTRWCIHFDWFGDCPAYRDSRRIYVYQQDYTSFHPEDTAGLYPEEDLHFPACFHLEREESARILTWFRQFFNIFPDSPGTRLQRRGIFLQILGGILDSSVHSSGDPARNSTFFHGKRLLDQYFTRPEIRIRDIAAELRITPNHLNKLFRRYLGTSPQLYLQNRRLLHAESLLKNSLRRIQEIAFESGFSDPNYFSRCFKEKNGITPKQFRSQDLPGLQSADLFPES